MMDGVKNGVLGTILAIAAEGLLVWQRLLIYTEAIKRQLIGGGIFGLLLGLILGSTVSLQPKRAVIAGVIGVAGIASFDEIVHGELNFNGRIFVLFILAFLIAASLSFLGAKVSQLLRSNKPAQNAED